MRTNPDSITWDLLDNGTILAETRWHLRRAVRVMNEVLARLGLEQHPDKTFIGRVTRGFDFLYSKGQTKCRESACAGVPGG